MNSLQGRSAGVAQAGRPVVRALASFLPLVCIAVLTVPIALAYAISAAHTPGAGLPSWILVAGGIVQALILIALAPLITGIGMLLPALIGGAVIIENIFAYPGMGRLGYEAVLERDYPTLVALNFVTAALVLLGNLLADVLYAVVDPRVRLE